MNKTLKKILIAILIVAAIIGAVWGILTLIRNAGRSEVPVYAVSDFYTDYSGSMAQCSGMVTTDKLQKVYISPTQTVNSIFVYEGQEVNVGDRLIAFDTTLSDLDLRQAEIALERQQLALQADKEALQKLLNAKTVEQLENEKAVLVEKLDNARAEAGIPDPDAKPAFPEGDGSFDKPLCLLWDETKDSMSGEKMTELLNGRDEVYVLLLTEDENDYYIYQGLRLLNTGSDIKMFLLSGLEIPYPPEQEKTEAVKLLEKELEELEELISESHSRLELIKLQNEMKQSIARQEIDVKISQLDYRRLKSEVQDGVIVSEIAGTVVAVRDETEAFNNGEAVIEVSGGGGYYIEGAVSELALDTVSVGQTVEVNSWMTGAYCIGEVVEISEYPTTNMNAWSDGNQNVSYYPMKVFVGADAQLREGDWVDMSYETNGGDGSSWYLESMFIRSENGRSYVYAMGADERLEKRFIQTGQDLWGSYTEIRGGLSMEDYVAFPYGKDIVEGAKTRTSTMDELYGW